MQITVVGYGRGNYDSYSQGTGEYIYYEARLEPSDDADESINVLRDKVNSKLGIAEQNEVLEARNCTLHRECKELEERLTKAKENWSKVVDFYEKLKIPLENPDYDPIPF